MQTSLNTRSPGISIRSNTKLQGRSGFDATSAMIPAEASTYAAHQQSNRDEESVLGNIGQLNAMSPYKDSHIDMMLNTGANDKDRSQTMVPQGSASRSPKAYVDDYEELLNTIEQEQQINANSRSNRVPGDVTKNRDSGATMPSVMTIDRARNSHTIDRHEEEPIIDFELERDMVGLDKTGAKKSKAGKEKNAESKNVIKANLNESSDFDLDNY